MCLTCTFMYEYTIRHQKNIIAMLLPISNIELYHTVVFVADKNPPENKKNNLQDFLNVL